MKQPGFDILTFGSITLDIIIKVPESADMNIRTDENSQNILDVVLGEKIQISDALSFCGGGSANSAIGFSKLGLKVAAFGVLGDKSNRDFILKEFETHNVETKYLDIAKNQSSSFSVILNTWTGERTVFHKRTSCSHFDKEDLRKAPKAKSIYISHLYECANDILLEVPDWKKKHGGGIFGWNPGKTQFKKGFDYFKPVFKETDILILTVEEAEYFTGLKSTKHEANAYVPEQFGTKIKCGTEHVPKFFCDVRKLAKAFLDAGVSQVAITDGARGAQVFTKEAHFLAPAQAVHRVDTLGAGDAFSVGLIAAKVHGKPLNEQILWASHSSASVIQKLGAQPGQLTFEQMQAVIETCKWDR